MPDHKVQPTSVLLVCLKVTPQHYAISNHSMYQLFSSYGLIKKLVTDFREGIASHKDLHRIFIKVGSLKCVEPRALNNTKIFEMIHCNIYFSPLKQLVLSRVPRTKGVDFTGYQSQPRSPLASQNDDDLSLIWSNQSSLETFDDTDTDDEAPPISNERLKEIRAKLDLIDNEIQLKIEENYQNAINKLNRKILVLSVELNLNLNTKAVYNLCGLFGNITFVGYKEPLYYIGVDGPHSLFSLRDISIPVQPVEDVPQFTEKYVGSQQSSKHSDKVTKKLRITDGDAQNVVRILQNLNHEIVYNQQKDFLEVEFPNQLMALEAAAFLNEQDSKRPKIIVSFT